MNMPLVITDNERKVKDALEVWAEWMRRDNTESKLGYGRCAGFATGGIGDWEDFERREDNSLAESVQAVYDGLKQPLQIAIDHFHLSAVWRSNRGSLEADYAAALIQMEVGLRRKNKL